MNYAVFPVNVFEQNTYVVWDAATLECALVDCGARRQEEWKTISRHIEALRLKPKYLLLTHCHFDHIMGIHCVKEAYALAPRYHALDQETYMDAPAMSRHFHMPLPTPLPAADGFLEHGQVLTLGHEELHVIHTPGHTPGGVCLHCPQAGLLFTGDTLFRKSLGRTDLGGDLAQEVQSVAQRLMCLPPATMVLPGHGPHTTLQWEASHNPYLL